MTPISAIIEEHRFDVVASLAFTWSGFDLAEPMEHLLAIARSPSPTKDALSMGLLAGELEPVGPSLVGVLELTALGRLLVRRFRHRTGYIL